MRKRFFFSTVNSGGVDPNYRAIINYATAQEYTLPSEPQQELQEQFIKDLKAAGIWSKLDILYVFATDGDEDFACINWKSPGNFTCVRTNTPAFIEDVGFVGDGDDAYLDTQWSASNNGIRFTGPDASFFIYINNNLQSGAAAGAIESGGGGRIQLSPRPASDNMTYGLNSGFFGAASTNSIGFFHIQRIDEAEDNIAVFKDGSLYAQNSAGSPAIPVRSIHILQMNLAPGISGSAGEYETGIFGAGASLNGKESDLYTAWNNYFSNL